MTKPHEHWEVMPHGKLAPIDEGILTRKGDTWQATGSLPERR